LGYGKRKKISATAPPFASSGYLLPRSLYFLAFAIFYYPVAAAIPFFYFPFHAAITSQPIASRGSSSLEFLPLEQGLQ